MTSNPFASRGHLHNQDNALNELDYFLEENDPLEQSVQSRKEILSMLSKREKDKEEIELESCFSELREKAGLQEHNEQIEQLANQSFTDLKQMQDIQGLYRQKPNDTGNSFYKPRLASNSSSQKEENKTASVNKPEMSKP